MQQVIFQAWLLVLFMLFSVMPGTSIFAADSSPGTTLTAPTTPAVSIPVSSAPTPTGSVSAIKSPSATLDVVKLSRAQVSEDIILSYVQNSGSSYSLSSDDIVRLRNEGVSDRVINTMLDQHKKVVETAQQTAAPTPVYVDNSSNASGAATTQPTHAEAPLTPPASTTYVIPYPQASAAYYGYPYRPYYYSPYYYGPSYYGYYGGPVVSFRFGFGGSHGHFHHRRGF